MRKHEQLFDGKKGVWKGQDATLQLKDEFEPSIQKPHGVPFPQRDQFKKELDRQCETGILRKLTPEEAEQADWGFTMFGIPKKNKKDIRTLIDYRKLNRMVKRNPCFIEPIHALIVSI